MLCNMDLPRAGRNTGGARPPRYAKDPLWKYVKGPVLLATSVKLSISPSKMAWLKRDDKYLPGRSNPELLPGSLSQNLPGVL